SSPGQPKIPHPPGTHAFVEHCYVRRGSVEEPADELLAASRGREFDLRDEARDRHNFIRKEIFGIRRIDAQISTE
ncbi:MAG TPA: hypothetical protein VNA31_08105, partial [bacterium]|nr:hypothetical protein [bacterium]